MAIPKFDPRELEVVSELPATPMRQGIKIFNYPVSEKEAFRAMMSRKPVWQIIGIESRIFNGIGTRLESNSWT